MKSWLAALLLALALPAGAASPLPADSAYRLTDAYTDQAGREFHLADGRGKPRVLAMFYTSCRYVCPLIIDSAKGVEKGLSPAETAAREAYEEAGLGGMVSKKPIGAFEYGKRLDNGVVQPTTVEVFSFEQLVQHPDWPEQGQRKLQWFSVPEAAEAVQERLK